MKNVESFYPLSPMQEGMLFHSLFDPGSGLYIELFNVRLKGNIDFVAFKQAWQQAVDRHSILRTSFVWEGVKEPIQVVHQRATLPFAFLDWRQHLKPEQEKELQNYLENERKTGFDLTKAPLMRLALIQMSDLEFQFCWIHHHILLDGWSVPILLGEVLQRYQAIRMGIQVELPAPRPFRDYIVWLKQRDLARAEAYWRKQLAGFSTPTPLPISRREHNLQTSPAEFAGNEVLLPVIQSDELQVLARRHSLTLNTVLQAAWGILLSRYSGELDIVYGTTISGRPPDLPGAETMLGLFINTLPVRMKVEENCSILEWLRAIQADQAEMRQYEYTPLLQIQNWSETPRGLALFESLFVFENLPTGGLDGQGGAGFSIEVSPSESYTNFPLTFAAVPGKQILLKITYNRDLFEPEIIQQMLSHYQVILESLVAHPEWPIGRLNLLTEAERKKLLLDWNDNFSDYPFEVGLAQLFEAQVERFPDVSALIFPGQDSQGFEFETLSYRELNQRANRLAAYLQAIGLRPGDPVGIFMERSLEMVVATLAVIKAGGAYLPLDINYPAERLEFMLADCRVSILVTAADYRKQLPQQLIEAGLADGRNEQVLRIVCLDSEPDQAQIASQPGNNLEVEASGASPAYIMYTSGSTGMPKGVAVLQRGVSRLVLNTNYVQIQPEDRMAHASNPSFDASTFEIWGAFLNGATLVGVPREIALSASAYSAYLRRTGINILLLTTALFNHIAHEIPDAFSTVKYLLFGGEAADAAAIRKVLQAHRPAHVINVYGPTEATCIGTTYEIQDLTLEVVNVPIGKPIANTQVYVLDEQKRPVPIGVPGELYLGGNGLAAGYLNRPDLTREQFIPSPFYSQLQRRYQSDHPSLHILQPVDPRLYKTGDLARYRPDGNLEFLGRKDGQVKLHGLRIELGEIEACLSQYPLIKENVVLMRQDRPGDKRLVAYLVPKGQQEEIVLSEVRRFLKERLPDFMIPAIFVFLDALPINPNGKVDRKALPEPEGLRPELEVTYEPPITEAEQILGKVWSQVLRLDRIGALDNFFELGGDSILSLQVVSLAKREGLEINYRQLFEHPTIRELAALAAGQSLQIVDQGPVSGLAPLTPVQRWYFDHHRSAPYHFNTSIMVEINMPLDLDLVQRALEGLILHHDMLRARFELDREGTWRQEIQESVNTLPFRSLDLAQLTSDQQADWIIEDAGNSQASIDLSRPPLMRVNYYQLGLGRSQRLLFIFHHLVFDGVSARIFVDDFVNLYLQLLAGKEINLPPKTTSYKHWSEQLFETAKSERIIGQYPYWARLIGEKYPRLPVDFPEGLNTYGLTEHITVSLSKAETEALLRQAPSRYMVSTAAILLAALTRWFSGLTGSAKWLVELEGHGRETIAETPLSNLDVSRTMGWFTTIYPMELGLDLSGSLPEQVGTIAAQLKGIPDRGIGFGLLKYLSDRLEIRQNLHEIPEPELNFNYLGQFDQAGDGSEDQRSSASGALQPEQPAPIRIISEPVGHEQDPASPRSARLYLVAAISDGQLGVRWLYSRGLHRPETIRSWADGFLEQIRTLITYNLS
jgi:amino acid adenylation domain-containing protein/non-ribosomal peptide synthase protein (TIGR01720 family)